MRDDQVRRYARHILVPDIGGLGQTALLTAHARIVLHESEDAALIAAKFLAAGGVGKVALDGGTDDQVQQIAAYGPDTVVDTTGGIEASAGSEVVLQPKPAWWPSAPDDDCALAYWRGSIAATRWMATVANG